MEVDRYSIMYSFMVYYLMNNELNWRGDILIMSNSLLKTDYQTHIKKPRNYVVIIHNDDYTTMDFVVHVLVKIFHKTQKEAIDIMTRVHNEGIGIVGVYSFDIAMTKKMETEALANRSNFPLKITIDEASE